MAAKATNLDGRFYLTFCSFKDRQHPAHTMAATSYRPCASQGPPYIELVPASRAFLNAQVLKDKGPIQLTTNSPEVSRVQPGRGARANTDFATLPRFSGGSAACAAQHHSL